MYNSSVGAARVKSELEIGKSAKVEADLFENEGVDIG